VQPSNRGTGIGVLLPLLVIEKTEPKANVVCLPSDHYIAKEDVLARSLQRATAARRGVDPDRLTLLGIRPSAPDTALGYLTASPDTGDVRPLLSFIEKPDREQAARLIRQGGVWNSGIIVGLLQAVFYLYSRHAPGLLRNLRPIVKAWSDPGVPCADLIAFYGKHDELDFSREMLQKQPARLQMLMVPPCGWSDIGTPARLVTTLRTVPRPAEDSTSSAARPLDLSAALSSALAPEASVDTSPSADN
jgi:mannose-1-phosphate guanylyltransferase